MFVRFDYFRRISIRIISAAMPFLWSLILFAASTSSIQILADQLFIPSEAEQVEGSQQLFEPFTPRQVRLQSQISSSSFIVPVDTFLQITSISFRLDSNFVFPDRIIDIGESKIELSTFQGQLSGIFEANHGADLETVYNGSFQISIPASPGNGNPAPFNITYVLMRPFFYNPKQGDLIIDIANNQFHSSKSVLIDFFPSPNGLTVNSTKPGEIRTGNPAFALEYTLVPEPTALSFIVLFSALALSTRRYLR